MNRQAKQNAAADYFTEQRDMGTAHSRADPEKAAAVDRIFGKPPPNQGGGFFGPAPAEGGGPSPTAPQPQVASPWDGFNPDELKGMFKGSIDINLNDPGKMVDGVEVKNPGKTLAPVNPRSGTN
jgi:hypothetical protein